MQFWDEFPECIFGLQSLDLHSDLTVEWLFGTQSLDPQCKTKTIGDIASKFTVKNLPKNAVDPNYKAINEMMQLIYSNVVIVLTPQGLGQHKHISIVMNPTIYTLIYPMLFTMVWINRSDPVVYPTVLTNTTVAHQDQFQIQHEEEYKMY